MIDDDKLREAFFLGFMVSREGYNGECADEYLAPDGVRPDGCSHLSAPDLEKAIDEFRADMFGEEEFRALADLAVARVKGQKK